MKLTGVEQVWGGISLYGYWNGKEPSLLCFELKFHSKLKIYTRNPFVPMICP
jgi:hypothetical protein